MELPFLQPVISIDPASIISSIGTIDTIGVSPIDDHQTMGIQQFNIIQHQIATNINSIF